uniref:uncharacterized protein LOC120327607 n=1 Tax=Styela clava TaxID=7725 RepID=UPI00193AD418|nr:uncharacterized protein LOC120327607 [Styela clava]
MIGAKYFILLCLVVSATEASRDRDNNRRGKLEAEKIADNNEPNWMKLCRCAKPALRKMQAAITEYTKQVSMGNVKRSSNYRPPALNDVIEKVTKIAYDCTKQPQCRCPEGYFKTNDGYHCLKISNNRVSCQEAVNECSKDVNARLAVAKDHERLTDLADYIREIDPTDESFYWIGLSYNRTDGGIPIWTWDDGTKASYAITRDLKNMVKKSLHLSMSTGETTRALERVAISKNYRGTHWKQETCVDESFGVKHKYICEFLMFKVHIKAVSTKQSQAANTDGKIRQY